MLHKAEEWSLIGYSLPSAEDQKIYIHVITGASAGGMTAAIAAQRLLYKPTDLRGPKTMFFIKHGWSESIFGRW